MMSQLRAMASLQDDVSNEGITDDVNNDDDTT